MESITINDAKNHDQRGIAVSEGVLRLSTYIVYVKYAPWGTINSRWHPHASLENFQIVNL